MTLRTYHRKRNFTTTPEPKGKNKSRKNPKNLFVIQKHAASHLHYDLRLELQGTLKSWAVPKGPCLDPSVKRLAMHVEDHPIDYGDFEGVIPEGQYGAGQVLVWDTGIWESMDDDPVKAYQKGHLHFVIKAKKLKGIWDLIHIKAKEPNAWLLIKHADRYAKPLADYDIVEKKPKSVLSGKLINEIS